MNFNRFFFCFHICNLYHGDIQNKKKPTIIYEKKNSKKIKIYLKSDLLRKLIMCYIVYDCLVKFHTSLTYCGRRLVRTFCMEMAEKNAIFYSVLSTLYSALVELKSTLFLNMKVTVTSETLLNWCHSTGFKHNNISRYGLILKYVQQWWPS